MKTISTLFTHFHPGNWSTT